MTTTHPFTTVLRDRFGGVLTHGAHTPDGAACALEAVSVARGITWTDKPASTRMPDLRPLNDAPWPSDKARTIAMTPLVIALWDWADWTDDRRQRWAENVALHTIREILPLVLSLWPEHAAACRAATTLTAAARAADAAADAGATNILRMACRIWIDAVKETA